MLEKRKLVDLFLSLVQTDSESGHERAMAERVMEHLRGLGAEVEMDSAGERLGGDCGNVVARLPGRLPDGEPDPFFETPFLLNAHLDTVSPGVGIQPKLKDDVVSAIGETVLGADDKAGVAIILSVLDHLAHKGLPHPPLDLVFTVGEETGLAGSRELDYAKIRATSGLALDGGALGTFITSAPYKAILDVEVQGFAAHAADPRSGVNAIQVAAQGVSRMHLGHVDDETTCNIGTFEAAGPINIVRDRAKLQLEIRSRNEGKVASHVEHLNRCLREGAASFVARYGDGERRAMVNAATRRIYDGYVIPESHPLIRRLVTAAEFLDIEPHLKGSMGGTDANNFAAHDITVVNVGVGIMDAHTTREHISTYDLFKAARLVQRVLTGH